MGEPVLSTGRHELVGRGDNDGGGHIDLCDPLMRGELDCRLNGRHGGRQARPGRCARAHARDSPSSMRPQAAAQPFSGDSLRKRH